MKLSNQNICNLQGCQMPLGGGGGKNLCLNAGGLLKEDGLI